MTDNDGAVITGGGKQRVAAMVAHLPDSLLVVPENIMIGLYRLIY